MEHERNLLHFLLQILILFSLPYLSSVSTATKTYQVFLKSLFWAKDLFLSTFSLLSGTWNFEYAKISSCYFKSILRLPLFPTQSFVFFTISYLSLSSCSPFSPFCLTPQQPDSLPCFYFLWFSSLPPLSRCFFLIFSLIGTSISFLVTFFCCCCFSPRLFPVHIT